MPPRPPTSGAHCSNVGSEWLCLRGQISSLLAYWLDFVLPSIWTTFGALCNEANTQQIRREHWQHNLVHGVYCNHIFPKIERDWIVQHRKAELELKIRKRVALEEKAHRIVERLVDNPISQDFLTDCVSFLSVSHFLSRVVMSLSSPCRCNQWNSDWPTPPLANCGLLCCEPVAADM